MARFRPLKVIIDTREKNPFEFPGHLTVFKKLEDGDYTLHGYSKWIRVERKAFSDFLVCLSKNAARLGDQLNRLCAYDYPLLVIEGRLSLKSYWSPLDARTRAGIVSRLLAEHEVQIVFCDTRYIANHLTLRFMQHAKENIDKGIPRKRKITSSQDEQKRKARIWAETD